MVLAFLAWVLGWEHSTHPVQVKGWSSGAGSPWPLVTTGWCWKQSSRWRISIYHYLCSRLSMFSQNTKVQKNKDSKLTMDVSLTSSISVIFFPYEVIICLQMTTACLFPLRDYNLRETKKGSLSAFMTNGDCSSTVLCFSLNRSHAFFPLCSSWSFDIWMCLSLKKPPPEILKNSFSPGSSDIIYILLTDAINKAYSQLQSLKIAELLIRLLAQFAIWSFSW